MKDYESRKYKPKALRVKSWDDKFTLGVFCQKTNTVEYARKQASDLRKTGCFKRLFDEGVSSAYKFTFEDIAYEISLIHKRDPEAFNAFIKEKAGVDVLEEMKAAVEVSHDWEDDIDLDAAKAVIDTMYAKQTKTDHSFIRDGYYVEVAS
jgi:hypothetical protein